MVPSNIAKLAEDLEKQELEAQNGVATPQVYEQLLAIYLYENDLCNAKYLWKRIPPSIKACTPELNNIWTVAQHMWKKDFPGIYKALNSVTWSDSVANIMKQVQGF
jgi:COP9 signalosome complex subunit 8